MRLSAANTRGKLKDAVHFLHLLELNEDEVKSFEALAYSEDDRCGKRALLCFHIKKLTIISTLSSTWTRKSTTVSNVMVRRRTTR